MAAQYATLILSYSHIFCHLNCYYWFLNTKEVSISRDFPDGSVKNLPANAGGVGSIPGPEESHGEGNGNPLQYSFLENPMDRGAWQTTEHGVAKSWTWQSNWVHTHIYTHTPCKKLLFLLDYSTDAHIVSSWITALMRVCTHTQHPPQETPFLTGLQHWCSCFYL